MEYLFLRQNTRWWVFFLVLIFGAAVSSQALLAGNERQEAGRFAPTL